MKCIFCGNKKTEVTNSRKVVEGTMIWRRRYCSICKKTFTTKEHAYADNLFVIKRNGSRQRFVYEKLFVSLFTSLAIRKNSDHGDNAKLAKKVSERIIEKLLSSFAEIAPEDNSKNVTSSSIIQLAYGELKKLGQVYSDHYIYYSEYRLAVAVKERLVKG